MPSIFQCPSVTSNPDFKITPLLDAEYLRNSTRCRLSYNGILDLYTLISNDLE